MRYPLTYRLRGGLLAGLLLLPMLIQLVHPLVHHHHHHHTHKHGTAYADAHVHEEYCPIGGFQYYSFQSTDTPVLSSLISYPDEIIPKTCEGHQGNVHISPFIARGPPSIAA